MTKIENSNFNPTQKPKLRQNSKTQILTNQKIKVLQKLKNSNCDQTQKLKFLQLKFQTVTKLNNSNCDKTQ